MGCPDETGVTIDHNDNGNGNNTLPIGSSDAGNGQNNNATDAGSNTSPSLTTDAGTTGLVDSGNNETPPPAEETCTCPDGYFLTPAQDACKKVITVAATNENNSYQVCDAQDNWVYGKFGAQYPDGTKIQNDYWGDNDGTSGVDGRLNEVGIWACDENTGQAGSQPTGEWIGFTHCLNLDSKSDYLVGIAADNRVRLKLNGEVVFENLSDSTSAFNYWWISALQVNSGLNIIEMQGFNNGGPASFGAEIAGPFPAGTLTNDDAMIAADYENNILFSTGVMIGEPFDVGEDSGWTCPEGYALNRCLDEPECTYIDVVPCLGTDGGL